MQSPLRNLNIYVHPPIDPKWFDLYNISAELQVDIPCHIVCACFNGTTHQRRIQTHLSLDYMHSRLAADGDFNRKNEWKQGIIPEKNENRFRKHFFRKEFSFCFVHASLVNASVYSVLCTKRRSQRRSSRSGRSHRCGIVDFKKKKKNAETVNFRLQCVGSIASPSTSMSYKTHAVIAASVRAHACDHT